VPFSSAEIGFPDNEDQGRWSSGQRLKGSKPQESQASPFFSTAHFSNSKRRDCGVFLQMRKAPQNRPKKLQTVKI
jgi:hypothetical protein